MNFFYFKQRTFLRLGDYGELNSHPWSSVRSMLTCFSHRITGFKLKSQLFESTSGQIVGFMRKSVQGSNGGVCMYLGISPLSALWFLSKYVYAYTFTYSHAYNQVQDFISKHWVIYKDSWKMENST